MLNFFKRIPKLFGHHQESPEKPKEKEKPKAKIRAKVKAKDKAKATAPSIAVNEPLSEEHPLHEDSPLQVVPTTIVSKQDEPVVEVVKEAKVVEEEKPVHAHRTKNTAFIRRPKAPTPALLPVENVTAAPVVTLDPKAPTAAPAPTPSTVTMKDEIERKAKEIRHRTHNHLHYYNSKGEDVHELKGRPLKSIFENDKGEKLPAGERQEKMRELQTGERKLRWR